MTRSAEKTEAAAPASANRRAEELASMMSLGPKSAAVLAKAGITSLDEVRRIGAVKTYSLAKRSDPTVTLNLLWALEGAILGQTWQVVAREHRASLLIALEDYERHLTAR